MKYAVLMFRGKFVQMLDEMLINCLCVRSGLVRDAGSWLQLLHKNSNLSNQLNIRGLEL